MKQRNFKEIYDVIYANVGQIMEVKRKAVLTKNILAFVIALAIWVFVISTGFLLYPAVLGFGSIITIFILYFVLHKINKDYKKSYKERIICEIVKQSNPNLSYSYADGISSREYAESRFDSGWDRYYTEDLITGILEDGSTLKMAQVHTQEEHTSTEYGESC